MEEPVAEDELETARNRILTDFLRRLNSNEGMARMLSSYQALGGDWRYLVEYEKQVAALTSEDLQEVARRYLHPGNRTVITLGRNGGES
jgi:predicted Zn-dependent peptidase